MHQSHHSHAKKRRGAPRSHPPFRSQGEAQIARCLERHGIDSLYEHPLAVVDRGLTRIWYPDFQLRPESVVIEYGGRLDDPCYADGWDHKHQVYNANGIDALMLTPADLTGDWPNRLLERIEQTLAQRLEQFRSSRTAKSSTERIITACAVR